MDREAKPTLRPGPDVDVSLENGLCCVQVPFIRLHWLQPPVTLASA